MIWLQSPMVSKPGMFVFTNHLLHCIGVYVSKDDTTVTLFRSKHILKSFFPILERLYHSICYWLMDKTNVALTLLLSPETASFCPFLRVWREITVASVFSWSRPKPEISYKIKWQRNISSIELFHRQSEEPRRSYCMTQGQRASRSIKQQSC